MLTMSKIRVATVALASPLILGYVTSRLWRRQFGTAKSPSAPKLDQAFLNENQNEHAHRAQSLVGKAKTVVNSRVICELSTAVELALRCGSEIRQASGKSGATWKVRKLIA